MGIVDFMVENAVLSLVIIGTFVSLFSSVFMKIFIDQEKIRELKKSQKELSKKIKELQAKGEFSKIEELNKELMDLSMQLMKSSFSGKQFILTTLPTILLFTWLRNLYIPILGANWFWIYFASTIVSSILLRKILHLA